MIDPAIVGQIIEQYKKHGWVLRRVLLSSPASAAILRTCGEIEPQKADIDALWFSRRSQPECEAWELRRLSGSPFALVHVVEDDDDDIRESILKSVQERMAGTPAGTASH